MKVHHLLFVFALANLLVTLAVLKVNFPFLDFSNKVRVSILQSFLCYELDELFQRIFEAKHYFGNVSCSKYFYYCQLQYWETMSILGTKRYTLLQNTRKTNLVLRRRPTLCVTIQREWNVQQKCCPTVSYVTLNTRSSSKSTKITKKLMSSPLLSAAQENDLIERTHRLAEVGMPISSKILLKNVFSYAIANHISNLFSKIYQNEDSSNEHSTGPKKLINQSLMTPFKS